MKHDHSSAVLQVVRYGLPLVILVFYISASWNFSYTPDGTFLSLRMAENIAAQGVLEPVSGHLCGAPSPFWAFFVALAVVMNINSLLAAKVFSLFFASLVILLSYLLATELLRDRFLAFCAALVVATSGLLLQVAPSGSALPLALAFVLAALFFMLRNDYMVAALMLGLGTLLFWQAAGGFFLLLLDAWLNSTTNKHRVRVILISLLIYLCTVVPWFLFASFRSMPLFPWLVGLDEFPGWSLTTGVATAVPAVVATAAAVGMLRRKPFDGLSRQSHLVMILWCCWFVACFMVWGWDFYLFALPLVIIYALSSVEQLAILPRPAPRYPQALLLTGVLILLHQVAFNSSTKPAIAQSEKDSEELMELAYWIKNGVAAQASVSARYPERLAYYAERPVGFRDAGTSPATEYVISEEDDVWGYAVVHRASRLDDDGLVPGAGRFAVWRKK